MDYRDNLTISGDLKRAAAAVSVERKRAGGFQGKMERTARKKFLLIVPLVLVAADPLREVLAARLPNK